MAIIHRTESKFEGTSSNLTTCELLRHKVVVSVPAYNEERFIGSVVLKLRQNPVKVLVVDDGSSDQTAAR